MKEEIYQKAKDDYYRDGSSELTDEEFDNLENELRMENNPIIDEVGFTSLDSLKFKHPSKMLSLGKIKANQNNDCPLDDFLKWLPDLRGDISLEFTPKYDGNSANLIYEDGKFIRALTRGNGVKGSDITSKIEPLIPKFIDNFTGEIRGEVVLNVSIFKEKYNDFKNPRNLVAGILNRDEITEKAKDLSFIAFDMKGNVDVECMNHLILLKELGFETPGLVCISSAKDINSGLLTIFNRFYKFRNEECEYQLDGIVCKISDDMLRESLGENNHHPKWALAIKFKPEGSVTTINSITWKMGKTGEFTPVAKLEPIELDGTTVSRCSLHNWKFIRTNKTFPGAKVLLVKFGDIIPGIVEIIKPSENDYKLFTHCPHCGFLLLNDQTHITCENPNCIEKLIVKFVDAIEKLEFDYLGESTIEKLYTLFKDPLDILNPDIMNRTNLIHIGFPDGKNVSRILKAIQSRRSVKLTTLIRMMGIDNLGTTISKQLANRYMKYAYDMKGLQKDIVQSFEDEQVNLEILKKHISKVESFGLEIVHENDNRKMCDEIIVEMTGSIPKELNLKTKKDFIEYANQNVNVQQGKLNKDTDYLLTNDVDSITGKMTKAKKLGVEVITYEDFIEKFKK